MRKGDLLSDNFYNFTPYSSSDAHFEAFQLGKLGEKANPYPSSAPEFKAYMLGYAYGQGLKGVKMDLKESPDLQEANDKGIEESTGTPTKDKKIGWFSRLLISLGLMSEEDAYNSFVGDVLHEVVPFNNSLNFSNFRNAVGSINTGSAMLIGAGFMFLLLKKEKITGFFSDTSEAVSKATR